MKELKLKDGSIIYIDNLVWFKEDKTGRIFDSNKKYLKTFIANDEEDYNTICNNIADMDNYTFFETFCDSYDYGEDPYQIMETYIDDITFGWGEEAVEQEVKEIQKDIQELDEDEFCELYDINKIGNIYFRGNW